MITLGGEDLSEKGTRPGYHSLIPDLLPKRVALFNQQSCGRRLTLSEGDLPLESERKRFNTRDARFRSSREDLLCQGLRSGEITLPKHHLGQCHERHRHPSSVAQFPQDLYRLLCEWVDPGILTLVEDHQGQSVERPGGVGLVACLPEGHQALLEQRARRCQVPPRESDVGQVKGGIAHPFGVSDPSEQRQALLTQHFSPLDVAQGTGQAPSSPQCPGAQLHRHPLGSLQRPRKLVPPLIHVFLRVPEPPQGCPQS